MGFLGDLEGFTVPEVLQVLVQGRKTGFVTLHDDAGSPETGLIGVLRGRVVHAERPGCEQGVSALVELLNIRGGSFRFDTVDSADFDAPNTIDRTFESLLLDASQEAGLP